MDILKARKKAAERKQTRKKKEPIEPPAAGPTREEPVPAVEAAPALSIPAAAAPVSEPMLLPMQEPTAKPPSEQKEQEAPDEEIELLSFRLGGEAYAIPVKDVREVQRVRSLTPVPNAPSYILGVSSLRGAILSVFDLCVRLGLTPGTQDEKARVIVVGTDEEDVGILVERVTGVLRIALDAIKPVPENIEQGAAYLRGIVRKEDKLYILLDLEKAVGA